MNKTKRTILTLLAVAGLALAIELCVVYYNANFAVNAKPSICVINDTIDCDHVAKTVYSQFLGVPLALWGIILYLFFLTMTFVDKLQNIKLLGFLKVFKNPESYIFCIGLLSFTLSMILAGISVFAIKSICVFCVITYFIDLFIAIAAKTKGNSILSEIKISFRDFIAALKEKKYLFAFIIVVLIVAGILTYTSLTNILAPQAAEIKKAKNFMSYDYYTDKNKMGPNDASVLIHEYMDFNCQGCFVANLYLHRIINEFENVQVIQHNIPLDITCNKYMKHEGHKNSCLKARYAIAAGKQNLYWQMSDILFEPNIETESDILNAAKKSGFNISKLQEDADSDEVKNEIQENLKDAETKDITGTPTFYIGMRKQVGITSYPEFKKLIINQGGKEKQVE
ncbi:MAG: thioredoxin domain-containing protein [Candidatus Gastranaerophilales bacterium]|nr:thioredoxin domain-containing protein [Candidatus Gastranaerophilales bacterium]